MSTTARTKALRLLTWISTAWFGMLAFVALLAMIDYSVNHYTFPQEGRGWAYQSFENQTISQFLVLGYGFVGLLVCRWVRQSIGWARLAIPVTAIVAWYAISPEW